MKVWEVLTLGWNWQPTVLVGCASLWLGYFASLGFKLVPRSFWFTGGVFLLGFALVSPLDEIGDGYLFSVHMAQHLLLLLVIPPLLLMGLPASLVKPLYGLKFLAGIERILSLPYVAWIAGVFTMWAWHWPALYQATLENEAVHIGEHLTFLISAVIFWWPLLNPVEEKRLSALASFFFLFGATVSSSILGIILTFSPAGLYPGYLNPFDRLGILSIIRTDWGLSPAVDQQIGGVMMWVLGGLSYLATMMAVIGRWFRNAEETQNIEYSLENSRFLSRNRLPSTAGPGED